VEKDGIMSEEVGDGIALVPRTVTGVVGVNAGVVPERATEVLVVDAGVVPEVSVSDVDKGVSGGADILN
jgi:hypothetical protein